MTKPDCPKRAGDGILEVKVEEWVQVARDCGGNNANCDDCGGENESRVCGL